MANRSRTSPHRSEWLAKIGAAYTSFVALVLFTISCASLARSGSPDAGTSLRTVTDKYTAWFFRGQTDSLWSHVSDQGRRRWPIADSLGRLQRDVTGVLTGFDRVLRDSVSRTDTLVTVTRFGINSRDGVTYYLRFRLTPGDHRISAIGAQDAGVAAETPYINYRTKARLRLPFDGPWVVFWGGRTVAENYHAAYATQRFAMDLIPVADSAVFARVMRGEATKLSDYSCFGYPVLAAGDGVVVVTVDSVPDNQPGVLPAHESWGNRVVIDHGTGEFSLLLHLKQGSVRVRPGQRVTSGEVVGACGNSGRITNPALHYDLVTRPVEGRNTFSLPAQFRRYEANGKTVERGEPSRWQRIRAIER